MTARGTGRMLACVVLRELSPALTGGAFSWRVRGLAKKAVYSVKAARFSRLDLMPIS